MRFFGLRRILAGLLICGICPALFACDYFTPIIQADSNVKTVTANDEYAGRIIATGIYEIKVPCQTPEITLTAELNDPEADIEFFTAFPVAFPEADKAITILARVTATDGSTRDFAFNVVKIPDIDTRVRAVYVNGQLCSTSDDKNYVISFPYGINDFEITVLTVCPYARAEEDLDGRNPNGLTYTFVITDYERFEDNRIFILIYRRT